MKAQEQGVARLERSYDELFEFATKIIKRSRDQTQLLMDQGYIKAPPAD
jgi:malate dehydrogenase (oxaloacetate-decarboxylating)